MGSPLVDLSLDDATELQVNTNCENDTISRQNDIAIDVFGLSSSCQLSVSLIFPGNTPF